MKRCTLKKLECTWKIRGEETYLYQSNIVIQCLAIVLWVANYLKPLLDLRATFIVKSTTQANFKFPGP